MRRRLLRSHPTRPGRTSVAPEPQAHATSETAEPALRCDSGKLPTLWHYSTALSHLSTTLRSRLINQTLAAEDTEHDMVLFSHMASAAQAAGAAGDARSEQALGFVARLLFIHIEGLDHKRPAAAAAALPPSNPDETELQAMRMLAERLSKPIARGRIADLVWQKARDHRMARLAVQSYLEAGAPFEDPEKWTGCTRRYARALQLAAGLGKNQSLFIDTLAHIEAALQKHGPTDTSFFSRELMDIVFDHKRRDPTACAGYAVMAEGIARRLDSEGELFRAREYWAAKEKWEYASGDAEAARASKTAVAESLVKEADLELAKTEPSYFRAAVFVREAVGILDKLQPDSRPRIAELRRLLAELNSKEASKPHTPSKGFDVSHVVTSARDHVKGKPLRDALMGLATITGLPNRTALEADVRQSAKNFVHMIFPKVRMGPDGTLVAASAGIDPSDPDTDPLLAEMVGQAQVAYGVSGVGIDVARDTIMAEHDLREPHFSQLAYASDFVPPGRELIFSKGLIAGMHGDFVTALHLLIPQLENSLRHILKREGENTVLVNRKGFDEERDLDDLLRLPRTRELFGDDLCFTLRALLLHRFGPNFRNLISHGLLAPEAASTVQGIYVWWLTLRLCYAPILAAAGASNSTPPAAKEPASSPPDEAPAKPSGQATEGPGGEVQ